MNIDKKIEIKNKIDAEIRKKDAEIKRLKKDNAILNHIILGNQGEILNLEKKLKTPWRTDIEKAPKDQNIFMMVKQWNFPVVGYYIEELKRWHCKFDAHSVTPLVWMPIPEFKPENK